MFKPSWAHRTFHSLKYSLPSFLSLLVQFSNSVWIYHRSNNVRRSYQYRLLRKFILNWDGRSLPVAQYIPPAKYSAILHSRESEISKHAKNNCFLFKLIAGKVQWMWIRNSMLVWKIHNWRKFPLPSQQPRFRGISLRYVDHDEFRRTIYPCITLRGVRLEEDRCFVENPMKVWGTRNLQNFVVDIFNYFYLASCRTFS